MRIVADSPEEYINQLPEERKEVIIKLRQVIINNLPEGFTEEMSYGMLGYVVPHSIYPDGYKTDPKLPLPFINLASQKNHVAVYHMGIFAGNELMNWYLAEYALQCNTKLDMGKSCIRFKKMSDIPYSLIGELASKISVSRWINIYEQNIK